MTSRPKSNAYVPGATRVRFCAERGKTCTGGVPRTITVPKGARGTAGFQGTAAPPEDPLPL